jgi:hypothetical protein
MKEWLDGSVKRVGWKPRAEVRVWVKRRPREQQAQDPSVAL